MSSLASSLNFTCTSSLECKFSESSHACGSDEYFAGRTSEVRVTWGRNVCVEWKCNDVCSMRQDNTVSRDSEGGSSHKDEPGMMSKIVA